MEPPLSDSLFERERAVLDDACRLAELWDTALRASFQLGYDMGLRRGVLTGRDEEATAWQAIVTGYAAVLDAPTRSELAQARIYSSNPCPADCGRCSSCIHAEYVANRT